MKKNLFIILCGYLFILPVMAQSDDNEVIIDESCSLVISNGVSYNFIFNWKKLPTESHWTGCGFAFSDLRNLTDANLNLSRSYSVVLNLGDFILPFNRHWLFAVGWGFDWSRYHFRGNIALQETGGITQFVPDPENRDYQDSKLLVYYATIPLLLEYQTKVKNNTFFIYGGVEGLIKLYSKSRAEIKTLGGIQKTDYRDLNLLPLNFRFTLRAGFDDFSIFGYYQPYSPFEKDKGPEVNPCGLGLMLNF
ncbi:MAG: PorT family protein [Candidatus Symbiothrix sp.]|jgi:hypothetical protein|nr:PorT family protein [Candidatus Symbiothrix sp.]